MTDVFLLGYVALGGLAVGALAERLLFAERAARRDSICPTCLGPTDDDGSSEAWGGET